MNSYFSNFPAQKVSKHKKTPKWFRECIDSVDRSGYFFDEGVRTSYEEKIICTNLYNNIIDKYDIEKVLNPTGIVHESIQADIQHYPIINPRIEVLIGEELKRRFDYTAVVSNQDAISEKEKERNGFIKQKVLEILETNYEKEELEQEIKKLQRQISTYQSKREKLVNNLLVHHWRKQKFDKIFNNGFKNALVQGEEYYEAAIVGGEPKLLKLDPVKLFWVRSGFSNKIEDSDLIIIDDYWSPGQIIDYYHDDLKDKHYKELERGFGSGSEDPFVNKADRDRFSANINFLDSNDDPSKVEELIQLGERNGYRITDTYDDSGNVRVLRVFWRGWRKVKKVTYFDDFGYEREDVFPEDYQVKEDEGETAKTIWINEWYEGTKIGNNIYLKLKPKEVQFRFLDNPAKAHPGIVGKTYSFDSFKTVSLMSKVKPYLYLYDAIHDRLNKLLAVNHGKILEMDFSVIPDNWSIDKWFHYLNKMKIAVRDSFKEGNKGAATGKLAGGMNNASKGYIDLDQGQNIQQHIALLEFVKREMTEITGVSEQRLGTISNRETLGGIERSVTQSSHITEWSFSEHEEVKIDALRAFVQACKIAYKGKKLKLQHILDDTSIETLNLDSSLLSEADFDVIISNSSKTQDTEQKIKQLAEVALNAGSAQFTDIVNIWMSNSLSDMKNTLEESQQEAQQRAEKQAQEQEKTKRQESQNKTNLENKKLELENIKNKRDNQTKLILGNNSDNDLKQEELELKRQQRLDELEKFNKKLQQDDRHHKDELQIKKKQANAKKTNT